MQSITLDVSLRTVFGGAHGELRSKLVELLEVAANPWLLFPGMLGIDPFRVPWLRISRLERAIDASLYRLIAERREEAHGGSDVLSMMIEARDEAGEPMTDVEIRDAYLDAVTRETLRVRPIVPLLAWASVTGHTWAGLQRLDTHG
jgi:cytochrome P450